MADAEAAACSHSTIMRANSSYQEMKPTVSFRNKSTVVATTPFRGYAKALYTVFTDENYHSGDNESWVGTAWPLVHVVGDKRFAAFLQTLDERTQRDIFQTIFYSGCYYPRALTNGYFQRRFPRV